ncbi:MAG: type II toxin-antitoxin system prevent-host-death family antitoxin [Chloroflexi bacterium]|nr:type II toxin-antitoxin system prevent-host-death family antitoxin [Chloroflexota bacterium]
MQATAKDLRFNVKMLLDTVARGEEVVITYWGKPHAKLVPFEDTLDSEDELFGIWADHPQSEDVNAYIRTIRKGRFE